MPNEQRNYTTASLDWGTKERLDLMAKDQNTSVSGLIRLLVNTEFQRVQDYGSDDPVVKFEVDYHANEVHSLTLSGRKYTIPLTKLPHEAMMLQGLLGKAEL